MLQATLHDWHVLSTKASVPWLRQVIEAPCRRTAPTTRWSRSMSCSTPRLSWLVLRSSRTGSWIARGRSGWPVSSDHVDALIAGVTCWRAPDGTAISSIPQRHVHYAPTGFDWGFGGSGPADLALNVLALFLPLAADVTGVALRDGSSVSEATWALHQEFKYDLIATLPRAGGAPHRRDDPGLDHHASHCRSGPPV